MADEPKTPPPAGPAKGSDQASEDTGQTVPVASAPKAPPAPRPAAPAGAKAPPPPPKPVVKPEPWSSPLVDELNKRFPGVVSEALIFRGQPALTLAKESIIQVAEFLKSEEGGAYTFLTDETAVDYPKREKRFEVVYHLYSFKRNDRLRLKILVGENETAPSVVGVWPVANWLEREIFDMFGVVFEGHPGLKRLLLPDDWSGHPLRKDYDILRQDKPWVQANLHIESGQ
jgi:NADH-quinone oxidoreductase subunit C